MLTWSLVTLVGFMALLAVVVVLASSSTAQYEREQRLRARKDRARR